MDSCAWSSGCVLECGNTSELGDIGETPRKEFSFLFNSRLPSLFPSQMGVGLELQATLESDYLEIGLAWLAKHLTF